MGIDISRQSFNFIAVQFFALLLLFWGRTYLFPLPIEVCTSNGYSLANWVCSLASNIGNWSYIVTMLIVIINAIEITRLISQNMILGVRNYAPMIFYLIISSGIFTPSLVSALTSFLIIESSIYTAKSFRRVLGFDSTFKSGMCLALASLLVFECIFLIIPLFIGFSLFRRTYREAFVGFLGFLVPFAFKSYIDWRFYDLPFLSYILDGWHSIKWSLISEVFVSTLGIVQLTFLCLCILTICLSVSSIYINRHTIRKRAYGLAVFFCWQLAFSILIFMFTSNPFYGYAVIAVPATVVMPYVFVSFKRRPLTILYFSLLVSIVASSLLYFLV